MRVVAHRTLRALAILAASALTVTALGAPAAHAATVPDELAVTVVGDGSTALSTNAAAGSIVLMNSIGALSGAVALPTAASGSQHPVTFSGTEAQTGTLHQSSDHSVVAVTGFGDVPGTATPNKSTTARVVASLDASGTVDATTTLNKAFYKSYPRGVATENGSAFWVGGKGDDAAASPSGGVVYVAKGASSPVAVSASTTDTLVNNARVPMIHDGSLYVSSDRTGYTGVDVVSSGSLPTSAVSSLPTVAAATPSGSDTPHDYAFVGDFLYVTYTGSTTGIAKYAQVSGAWTQVGFLAGTYWGLTGRVAAGDPLLYAVKGTGVGNLITQLIDTGGSSAFSAAESTVATASADTTYRGVAFAPGFTPGTGAVYTGANASPTVVPADDAFTTDLAGSAITTTVTVADADSEVADLSLAATSSSESVATVEVAPGTGDTRTLTITPVGIGRATITATVTDADGATGTATIAVGVSGADAGLNDVRYLTGASDASTVVEVGDGYAVVGDDESNTLRLYNLADGGAPVASWNFSSAMGQSSEIDIEGAAKVGDTIYWTGSHGNNKSGVYQAARNTIFATKVSGSGASTTLSYGGAFTGLREQLAAWSGASALGLDTACALTSTTLPDSTSGCNIEGLEFSPDDSQAYFAFRAPVASADAIIVPVNNLPALVAGTDTQASFGTAITLDLGKHSIRELRKNSEGQYLITAGVPDDTLASDSSLGWELFAWDGPGSSAKLLTALPTSTGTTGEETGSWESIAAVPADYSGTVSLITDNGTTSYYGDGTGAKDESYAGLKKSRVQDLTITTPIVDQPSAAAVTVSGTPAFGETLTAVPSGWADGTAFDYQWYAGDSAIGGATSSTLVVAAAQVGKAITVSVSGTKTGYATLAKTSAATAPVAAAAFPAAAKVSIAGTAKFGQTLTAVAAGWPTGTSLSYQWRASGSAIPGATRSTLLVGSAVIGKTITVTVTAAKAGYVTVSRTSSATASVVKATFPGTHTVAVTGRAKVGRTLTATVSGYPSGASRLFVWKVNGVRVKTGASAGLVVKKAWKGKRISVTVTVSQTGFVNSVVTSARTAKVVR